MRNTSRVLSDAHETLKQDLFTYIKKNKAIPEKLAQITDDDPKLAELREALTKGNPNAEIFSNSKCDVYLLYLIQKNEISLLQGMTAYSYLMVLMQFTDKQNLKKEKDEDLKDIRDVEVQYLAEEGKITPLGKQVIQHIIKFYEKFNYQITAAELENFILNLPKSEQWLVKLPVYNGLHESYSPFDRTMQPVKNTTPFIYSESSEQGDKDYYFLPSMTMIDFLIKKMSRHPMNMRFVFGSIGSNTLLSLHQDNFHPTQLYSKRVASNPVTVHERRCGPVAQFFHDINHIFYANLFKTNERKTILKTLIPILIKIEKKASVDRDSNLSKKINDLIAELNDFNLDGGESSYRSPKMRLQAYLQAIGREFSLSSAGRKIDSPNLVLSYLLGTLQPPLNRKEKVLIENLLPHKLLSSSVDKEEQAILALIELTKANRGEGETLRVPNSDVSTETDAVWDESNSESENESQSNDEEEFDLAEKKTDVDWAAWVVLLEKPMEDKELWEVLKNNHYDELLTLITTYGLDYYPPYLPMTDKKRGIYLEFFRNQAGLQMTEKPKENPKEKTLGSGYTQFGKFGQTQVKEKKEEVKETLKVAIPPSKT